MNAVPVGTVADNASALAQFDPARYRADFPILSSSPAGRPPLAYLDNAATTQRPTQVIRTMVDVYEKDYANVHRGIHWLSDRSTDLFEEARDRVRRFIGAEAREEIVFTRGATEGINLVARAWGDAFVTEGDEILVSEMEHHANLVPWMQLSERTGAKLRYLPILPRGVLDLSTLDECLHERTRIVAITAMSNVLGTINPLSRILARARQMGAVTLIDAAQSAPSLATDVSALGVDFLAFSGHKLMGPTGIGVLYGRREMLEKMPPFLGGGSMIRRVRSDGFEPADLPAKFEAGTPPIVPAIGLGAAIEYLTNVGLERVLAHETALVRRAHEALSQIEGVRFLGPGVDEKGGIVTFTLQGVHAHDIAQLLDREGIAIRAGHHCAMPLHTRLGAAASARASFYFYNTIEEVDRLADALRKAQRVMHRR